MDAYEGATDGTRTGHCRIPAARFFLCLLVPFLLLGQTLAPASDAIEPGTLLELHSDQRVVQSGRWFLVREFTIAFSVRAAQASYCGEINTTDATEAHDLINSRGQSIQVAQKGKDLEVTLQSGRRLRAHRLAPDRCPRS